MKRKSLTKVFALSLASVLQDIILGRSAHVKPEGFRISAWITKTCLFGNLGNGISSVQEKRNALTDAIICQVFCDGSSCHLFKEPAAKLLGKVQLLCKLPQRKRLLVIGM